MTGSKTEVTEPKRKKRCGRPRLENMTYFRCALPMEMYLKLSDEAEAEGVTIRDLYRRIIGVYLCMRGKEAQK